MSGAAVSGFVDGLFKGIGVRHGWEDRKDDKARQKRLDEIRDAEARRADELHQRRMGAFDREASDWSRARAADDVARNALMDSVAYTDSFGPYGGTPTMPPMGAMPQQPTASATPSVPPSAGLGAMPGLGTDLQSIKPNRAASLMERMMPAQQLQAEAASKVVTPRRPGRTPEERRAIAEAARRGQLQASPEAIAAADRADKLAGYGVTFDDWRAMSREERAAAGLPKSEIGGQMHFDRLKEGLGPKDALPNQVARFAAGVPVTLADRALGVGGAIGAGLNGAAWNAASGAVRVLGNEYDEPLAKRLKAQADKSYDLAGRAISQGAFGSGRQKPAAQQAPAAAAPPPSVPVKATATPQEKQAAATAVETLDASASPEVKDATVAATQAMGVKPGQKTISDAQYERGADAWADRWMEVGAPRYVENMIRAGQFDKVEKFQEFMQAQETRAGMRDWSIAAAAATLGDIDRFGEHIVSAYNRMGYFPDGTELDKEASGFTRDKNGEVNGAKLTFRDTATGQTFEQVFSGPDDLIKTGITLLAPENAFEYYWKQQEAAAKGAIGALERVDQEKKAQQEANAAVIKTAMEMVRDSLGQITLDQAIEQILAAQEQIARGGGASGGAQAAAPPPIAHRP